jgi:hypothetical protein
MLLRREIAPDLLSPSIRPWESLFRNFQTNAPHATAKGMTFRKAEESVVERLEDVFPFSS